MTRKPRKPKVDTWAEEHHAAALEFLRRSLSNALGPHLDLLGQSGHLTPGEIMCELAATMLVVAQIARDASQEAAP